MTGATLQKNTEPYPGEDVRKYEVGRALTFVAHSPQEEILSPFRPGDVVTVLPANKCGMGIDVVRSADSLSDMVWADEVST